MSGSGHAFHVRFPTRRHYLLFNRPSVLKLLQHRPGSPKTESLAITETDLYPSCHTTQNLQIFTSCKLTIQPKHVLATVNTVHYKVAVNVRSLWTDYLNKLQNVCWLKHTCNSEAEAILCKQLTKAK